MCIIVMQQMWRILGGKEERERRMESVAIFVEMRPTHPSPTHYMDNDRDMILLAVHLGMVLQFTVNLTSPVVLANVHLYG